MTETAPQRKALDLSQEFFEKVALPSMQEAFPGDWIRMGIGLVGNGSECFGFDDELSCDHDWGTEFLVWLTEEDYERIGDDVRAWKARLWEEHADDSAYPFREISDYGVTTTVMTPGMFYSMLIGFPHGPQTVMEWRRPPEANLALCVNGRVFADPVGEFSRTRDYLQGYYPEDLRRKKIAARCMSLAQTGQYNYLRIAQRGDTVAKHITLGKFVQDAISMAFMLNKRFMPYYKWAFRAMTELPLLASDVAPLLELLYADDLETREVLGSIDAGNVIVRPVAEVDFKRAIVIERICALFADELRRQGLSSSTATFLARHGEEVQRTIGDPVLSKLPPQFE